MRRPCSQSWTGTDDFAASLLDPLLGMNTDSRVSVFVHDRFPDRRSAPRGGQATRWRPDSAVSASPEQPLLHGLTTRGLQEGEDILFADHNTQTKPFMARLYLLHLHRKHTLFARKTLFKHFFKYITIDLLNVMYWFSLHLFFQLFIVDFIKEKVGFPTLALVQFISKLESGLMIIYIQITK